MSVSQGEGEEEGIWTEGSWKRSSLDRFEVNRTGLIQNSFFSVSSNLFVFALSLPVSSSSLHLPSAPLRLSDPLPPFSSSI